MNRIRVDLLGRAGLVDECGRHSPLIPQDAAVLALLALEGTLHREHLATWIWPDGRSERSRGNLRQRVLRLRSRQPGIVVGRDWLDLGDRVDCDALIDRDHEGVVPAATPPRELLEHMHFPDCDELSRWLETQRARRRARWMEGVDREAGRLASDGDFERAIAWRRLQMREDPLDEARLRVLMRLFLAIRDPASALQALATFRACARRELGVDADPSTIDLLKGFGSIRLLASPWQEAPARSTPEF